MNRMLSFAIIVKQGQLKNIPLADMEQDEDQSTSFNYIFDQVKKFTNNPYKEQNILWDLDNGELFRIQVWLPKKSKYWKIKLLDNSGTLILGWFKQKKGNYVIDKLSNRNHELLLKYADKYKRGFVRCQHCRKWIRIKLAGGRSYEGLFCKKCWKSYNVKP